MRADSSKAASGAGLLEEKRQGDTGGNLCLYFLRLSPLFSLCRSVNISMSLYLSLCHSLKEEGKTHILPLLLPLQIFFPPLFPLRKFPICLCAGLVERPSVETEADAHTDWEAHSCMWSFTNSDGSNVHRAAFSTVDKHSFICIYEFLLFLHRLFLS